MLGPDSVEDGLDLPVVGVVAADRDAASASSAHPASIASASRSGKSMISSQHVWLQAT